MLIFPTDLSNEIMKCKADADVEKVGTEWLLQQSRELKKAGVPVLHYYTLGKTEGDLECGERTRLISIS